MYLPRTLIAHLYLQLARSQHALSPPVLILAALEPDALCATRILSALLKRDYIPHKIKPIAGYGDLMSAGTHLVQPMRLSDGGSGGVVICLGVGGLVNLASLLGLEQDEGGNVNADGVDIWVLDSRRPYNLANVFGTAMQPDLQIESRSATTGVNDGQLSRTFKIGAGGIVVWDDGDIVEDLASQRAAHFALERMRIDVSGADQVVDGNDSSSDESDSDRGSQTSSSQGSSGRKRKSWQLDREESDSEDENPRPSRRRRSGSIDSRFPSPSVENRHFDPTHTRIDSTPPSNQMSSQPDPAAPSPKPPSRRQQRRAFLRERRKHSAIIEAYHTQGTSYSEPVSSIMYSLASELGREDNDLLWLAIIGVSSSELYGRTSTGVSLSNHDRDYELPDREQGWTGSRGFRIRQLLRDEVKRLNPPELNELGREIARGHANDIIQTHAKSPTDTAIRLSPEPRFLLIRHWSLYDSMLHSPYLSTKLHIWNDSGRRRLHKLLAKMGVSLSQSKQNYTHMDMELKKVLRERLLEVAPMYDLEGLVPPASNASYKEGWGFVRSWGWKACLSATDVAVLISAVLDVDHGLLNVLPHARSAGSSQSQSQPEQMSTAEDARIRFYTAYDSLLAPARLTNAVPIAQSLYRSIIRTGTTLLQKKQIKHLRAFRMGLIKEGPDVGLFCAPGALTKLALWLGDAIAEGEPERRTNDAQISRKLLTPLVLGCLEETRGLYVVVGLGGGGGNSFTTQLSKKQKDEQQQKRNAAKQRQKEARRKQRERERARRDDADEEEEENETEEGDSESNSSSSDEDEEGDDSRFMRNRFGFAFSEAAAETNARVKQDSFEHCVIEVKKEDLSGFLEHLSQKTVVG
ncbi:MAG: hypothetical protein Q9162_007905 [Coniocarpon cinnabarinum]